MKKQILLLITLAIAICGCQKEESYPSAGNQDVIGAVIASETGTKTTMNGTQVVWEDAEEISIFSQAGNAFINNKYTLLSGGNTTNATFTGHFEGESKVAAFYPYYANATYSADGIAFTLPDTYTYENDNKNNKAPMAAVMTSASNDIVFLNAGALMTVTVRNIPAGYNVAKLYVTDANGPALAGDCVIAFEGGIPTMKVANTASAKEVTITFDAANEVSTKTFHFPIPVGNYTTLEFAISNGTETKVLKSKPLNAQRNKQYKTTITLDSVTGNIPEETTMEAVEEDLKTKPNVTIDNVSSSDNAEISLPVETAGKEVNINFESIDANVDEIVINSADANDAQVPTVLNITVPTLGDQTKIAVDMPNTTVTITAADTGVTTTIPELTASTADQTLIVESGVTIEKLIVEKGNVRVKKGAKILAIERTQTNTDALTYVIYEEDETVPGSVTDQKIFLVKAEDYAGLPSIGNVHYKNLQYAVDAASKGDVIEIPAGTYKEVVKVTGGKEITLKAIEKDVVIAGLDHQSNANPSTVKVEGVTFDNSLVTGWFTGTSPNITPCVGAWGGYLTFENCTFIVDGTSGKETGVMTWWVINLTKLAFDGCTFVGKDDHANARAMQIYGNVNMDVKNSEFTTKYRYALKYVGGENGGNVALFSKNKVYNSQNFVELGSAPYAGMNYEVQINNTTLGEGVNPYVVANEEGQTVKVDGKLFARTATQLAAYLTADKSDISVVLTENIDLPISSLGTITGGSGEYKLGGESTNKIDIDLNGKTLNITTTYWSNLGAKNNDALFTIKNGKMTSSQATGTWNSYDLTFSNCNYNIDGVEFEKAVAFTNTEKSVSLNNVIINETHDYYALWISARGQNVTIDSLTVNSAGRGIKIDEQYVGTPSKVNLSISNSTFNTVKKSAIIVKSAAGADITLENINIENVAADKENEVWCDEEAANYNDLITVTGGTKIVEGSI